VINGMSLVAAAQGVFVPEFTATQTDSVVATHNSSWFEAMAQAWGEALNKQAGTLVDQAAAMSEGEQTPASITMLTAESLRMQVLSNSSHTSMTSMGSALETMARKQ